MQAALHPDPDTARSWLERELSRPEYHESLLEQLRNWLGEVWLRLQSAALGASPLSTAAFVVVLVVLVLVVVLVATRVRNDPTRHGQRGALLVDGVMNADEHRRVAETCLASGDLDVALVEGFRAIATRAVQRGVLEDRPGLTAHELTVGLGPAFPDHADALASGLDAVRPGVLRRPAGDRGRRHGPSSTSTRRCDSRGPSAARPTRARRAPDCRVGCPVSGTTTVATRPATPKGGPRGCAATGASRRSSW